MNFLVDYIGWFCFPSEGGTGQNVDEDSYFWEFCGRGCGHGFGSAPGNGGSGSGFVRGGIRAFKVGDV